MELHLVPLARMTATERPATLWRIDVHVKADQGAVCLFIGRNGRDELDRLLAEGRWPVKRPVETDVLRSCWTGTERFPSGDFLRPWTEIARAMGGMMAR